MAEEFRLVDKDGREVGRFSSRLTVQSYDNEPGDLRCGNLGAIARDKGYT